MKEGKVRNRMSNYSDLYGSLIKRTTSTQPPKIWDAPYLSPKALNPPIPPIMSVGLRSMVNARTTATTYPGGSFQGSLKVPSRVPFRVHADVLSDLTIGIYRVHVRYGVGLFGLKARGSYVWVPAFGVHV